MSADSQNLFDLFFERFPEDLSKPLLRTLAGAEYSYADAIDESGRMARCLSDLGLRAGDRVTVQVEKSPEAVWLYLACLRGGFVFHPLNMDYQLDELVFFVDNAKPAAVVCDPVKEKLFAELTEGMDCEILTLDATGAGTLAAAIAETPPAFRSRRRAADDMAVLLYSSGTTGVPKGAKLSHGNLAANTLTLIDAWGFSDADVLLHALPIHHAHGLFVGIGCALMSGSSMLFIRKFTTDDALAALPECTVMMGVPTFYTRLLADERLDRELTAAMRLFISGSAPLLPETFAEFEARTGHRILERYGMTETSMNASNPLNGERRPGSVGPALPGVSLRVVDEADRELPSGEIGHLQVRGPNVFSGYWRVGKTQGRGAGKGPGKKTAAKKGASRPVDFTDDGYFRTGDLASIDADGYVTIVGRSKDMIITGGLNVYPREVESLLDGLPQIAESAVVGVPHPDFGEGVIAVVVATDSKTVAGEELIAGLREHMAAYKLPKQVFAVDALPRNAMGKVQKNLLREAYADVFRDVATDLDIDKRSAGGQT